MTEASNKHDGLPQWWPGQQDVIIFGSSEELGPGSGYPTTVGIDGGDCRQLDRERDGPVALIAGDKLLAYGGFDEPCRIVHQGSEPEDFFPSEYGLHVEKVFQPAWSPDGRQPNLWIARPMVRAKYEQVSYLKRSGRLLVSG